GLVTAELMEYRLECGPSLPDGDARPQPPHDFAPIEFGVGVLGPRIAGIDAVRQYARALRQVNVVRLPGTDPIEPWRRNSDDYERNVVDNGPLADGLFRAPDPPLREAVADRRDGRGAAPVVLHADQPAGRGRRPQRTEESARDVHTADGAAFPADERGQAIRTVEPNHWLKHGIVPDEE